MREDLNNIDQGKLDALDVSMDLLAEDMKILTTTKSGKIVPAGKQQKPQKLKSISAAELDRIELPEISYPIARLIPEGTTVIAAPPKSGKSWMVLLMALAVSRGENFLEQFQTQKCDVLYIDLEDGPKFGQERLRKLCPDGEIPENLHYIFEGAVPLDEGFIDQLEELRADIPNLGLIIIDTLRFIACRQKKNESAYSCDYRTGQMLKTWCDKYGISIIEVTHTTKLIHPDDALANVSGTNGVTGAADAVLVIAKDKRTSTEAVLAVDGRRVRQAEFDLRINWDSCRWEYIGISDADERERQQRQREIEELRSSIAYKAALKIANHYTKGWKGTARNLIDTAADFGIFITESPKEVGGMLSSNKVIFAQDGVRIEIIKNGNGGNFYRLSSWEESKEGDTLFNYH